MQKKAILFMPLLAIMCASLKANDCQLPSNDIFASFSIKQKQLYFERCLLEDLPRIETQSDIEWKLAEKKDDTAFWSNWKLFDAEPLFTFSENESFYGLDIWTPPEEGELEVEDWQSIRKWLRDQGLQMSFGFGDGETEPRFRFDYRFHEDSTDALFFQVDIPLS